MSQSDAVLHSARARPDVTTTLPVPAPQGSNLLFGLPIVLDTDNESLRPGQNVSHAPPPTRCARHCVAHITAHPTHPNRCCSRTRASRWLC